MFLTYDNKRFRYWLVVTGAYVMRKEVAAASTFLAYDNEHIRLAYDNNEHIRLAYDIKHFRYWLVVTGTYVVGGGAGWP